MTLRQIISALELIDRREGGGERQVYFAFCGAFPVVSSSRMTIDSSRCYYERPAIDWAVRRRSTDYDGPEAPTVSALLAALRDAVGKTVEGYKGGTYTISDSSPLHVDGHGECTSTVVSDVVDDGWQVLLLTEHES